MDKQRRHPLAKQFFLEGNRQRWVAIGLLITLLVLVCDIIWHVSPSPYLQSVMILVGSGILGLSADSLVKTYKVESRDINEKVKETVTTNVTVRTPKAKYFDDEQIS